MLKKIAIWLLCVACLLTVATSALADDEPAVSDVEPVSDVEDPSLDEPPVESDETTQTSLLVGAIFVGSDLLITVTDEAGALMPDVHLSFDVGEFTNVVEKVTDADGAAILPVDGLDPGAVVVCHADGFTAGSVTYLSASATVTVPGDVMTDTTTAPDTTTTETETPTTAATVTTMAPLPTLPSGDSTGTTRSTPSYADAPGATTTHVRDGSIYTNLLIDEHLLGEFGYSIDVFNQNGRLILDQSDYASLTDAYGSHLFGKLTTSVLSDVTADQIRTAKEGVQDFADCDPNKAVALTFGVSLQFLGEDGNGLNVTDTSALGSDIIYEFSLPVPKSMEHCKSFGIAMTGENALTTLTPVAVRDGVISFRTRALGHFTIVGFADGTGGGSPLRTIMWLLIGGAVLVFALMGFLIYRFFIRGRKQEPDDDEPDDGSDDSPADNAPDTKEDEPPIPIRIKKDKK